MIKPHHSVNGADAPMPAPAGTANNLAWRIASAAVLAPAGLLCTYLGGWLFLVVCALAAGAILWEWTTLVSGRSEPRVLIPGLIALAAETLLIGNRSGGVAAAAILAGAIAAALAVAVVPPRDPATARWGAGGIAYAGVALFGAAILRGDPELGLTALLFLFATVWSTDILAYFVGRSVGGPLLWPRLSPKKTWAGALGGLAGGVAAGTLVAYASGGTKLAVAGILGLGLSIAAQAGDLFESAVKRRFGAKDASTLIPGHGGVMDRLDGFLVAALAAAAVGILRQGFAAPAQGLFVW